MVTDAVVVRFVGTPSATGTGANVSPVTVRSGRSSDTVAPPYPVATPAWTSTRTPWLPTSVLAGVSSSYAGAFTVIRRAPTASVEPRAVVLMAGMITRTEAFGAVVFA